MFPAFLAGASALGICTLLHLLALKLFPRWGLLDRPEKYQLSRTERLPYPTGILSVLTFLLLFIFSREAFTLQVWGLIVCVSLLAVVSLIDDLRTLPPSVRLSLQIFIGFLLFATGTRIYTITNPLGGIIKLDTIDLYLPQLSTFHSASSSWPSGNFQLSTFLGPLPLWSGVFTIGWIVLTTNAFNWFDGIPGQVSILTVIGSATLGLLALSSRVEQPEIALIAFILLGCALASTLFDFPPNRTVLGDTGAMFFGLMLGTLSIYAGGKVATAFLVLGVPLIDAAFVLARRIIRRESPFHGNLDHLHHRLLRKGWSERHVIILTVAMGTAFGTTALSLSTFQKFLAILLLVAIVILLTWYSRDRVNPNDGVSPK